MPDNSPELKESVTAAHPIAATRLRWLDLLSKYRQPIGLALTLLLFAIALIACRHLLSELDLYALQDSILEVPKPALLGALAATAVGFVILLGYEWLRQPLCGSRAATQNPGLGWLYGICHRQRHRLVAAVRRLRTLSPVCTPWRRCV